MLDPVSLILPGGTTEVLVRLETQATAQDAPPAPIPLPAGLPLLLAGSGAGTAGLAPRRVLSTRRSGVPAPHSAAAQPTPDGAAGPRVWP